MSGSDSLGDEEQQDIRTDGGIPFSGYDGERPDDKHENEIFDMVLRKGPIDFDQLMKHISTYSRDEVSVLLSSLESKGFVEERGIDTEYDFGTITNDKWCVVEADDGE